MMYRQGPPSVTQRDRLLGAVRTLLVSLFPALPIKEYSAHLTTSRGVVAGSVCPSCHKAVVPVTVALPDLGVKGFAYACSGCQTMTFQMEK